MLAAISHTSTDKLTPWTSPLAPTPRISQQAKPFAINFHSPRDGICVALNDTFARATTTENSGIAAKEKVNINFQDILLPEEVFIEDVGAEEFGRDTTCEIFETLSGESSFDSSIVLEMLA
jgi:hypothetical protein